MHPTNQFLAENILEKFSIELIKVIFNVLVRQEQSGIVHVKQMQDLKFLFTLFFVDFNNEVDIKKNEVCTSIIMTILHLIKIMKSKLHKLKYHQFEYNYL